jgi:hypothetical protein
VRAEIIRAGRADDGPAQIQNAADRVPVHLTDAIATFHHALIAFVNGKNLGVPLNGRAHDGAYRGIHAGRIAAAG